MLSARPVSDAEVSHDEAARELDDYLVHGLLCRTKMSSEVPIETMLCASGVTGLMAEAAVVAGGIDEFLERRHEDRVNAGTIAGFIAARNDRNVQCSKKGVGFCDALGIGQAREVGRCVAVDLSRVEDLIVACEEAWPIFVLIAMGAVGGARAHRARAPLIMGRALGPAPS
jgi:hypothetical protein